MYALVGVVAIVACALGGWFAAQCLGAFFRWHDERMEHVWAHQDSDRLHWRRPGRWN